MAGKVRTRRSVPVTGALGVTLVLVLAGFLFAANARLAAGTTGREPQDLAGLVETEMARLEEVETEVHDLEGEVVALAEELTAEPSVDEAGAVAEEALVAGRVAVTGPGLTVQLDDAPTNRTYSDEVTNDMLVVHQQDLQAVINALWAGGAEAMTLQGQRVVATSAFRCVGNVLLLHGQHYSPPYTVQAIGDPDALRAALREDDAIEIYLDYVEQLGLGWSVTREAQLELPAYEGSVDLKYAALPEGVEADADAES